MTHSADHAIIAEIEDALDYIEKDMKGIPCRNEEIEEMAAEHILESVEVQKAVEARAKELIEVWKRDKDDIEATDRRAWAREKSRQLNSMN